jgi:DNA-directed RNA polymerase subunit E'/Rpb7
MDPLFERRALTKKVHIHAKFLQRNIQASLMAQLKMQYQGRCLTEGYIHKDSITITNSSVGRANYIRGGVDYDVGFQADVCMPHIGQRFKAPIVLKSKIGLHAEVIPIKVLIPRDLHIGNESFEAVNVAQEIEFEVVGTQFKQGDEEIIVVGKLLTLIQPEPEVLGLTPPFGSEAGPEVPAFDLSGSGGSDKKIVITAPVGEEKPKRRKLKRQEEVKE